MLPQYVPCADCQGVSCIYLLCPSNAWRDCKHIAARQHQRSKHVDSQNAQRKGLLVGVLNEDVGQRLPLAPAIPGHGLGVIAGPAHGQWRLLAGVSTPAWSSSPGCAAERHATHG